MPRGTKTLEFLTPVSGARFDLPVHKLGADMLAAGSYNVQCDQTSILRARNGFLPIAKPGPQRPITGGASWEGVGGAIRFVVADTGGWWSFAVGAFTPLAGGAPVGPDDFTQFAVMAVNGLDTLYGVNNNSTSGLVQWLPTQNFISSIGGLPFTAALGCFVLANRLVVYGTTELVNGVSTFFPYRVRWSEFNNPTSFLPANVNDLVDPGGGITAAMRMGNLQAFMYMAGTEGTGALWSMSAQVGDDANAFAFSEFAISEGVVPPASVAAIMAVEGFHYYLGQDGHIWQFNGIAPQNFGVPIQSDILANANMPYLKHAFCCYVPGDRHARFFFPSGQNQYCDRCVYYSFDFNRWEAPAEYLKQFRGGFTGPLSTVSPQAAYVGGVDGSVNQLDASVTDNGAPIPFAAVWGPKNTSPLEKMQVNFVEGFIAQANKADKVVLEVTGLREPLGVSDGGAAVIMDLSQESQFQQLLAPGRGAPGAEHYEWIQVSLLGTVSGTLQCLGAYVHVNPEEKGVYNRKGLGPQ